MSLKKLLTAIVTVSMVFSLVVPAVSADAASDLLAAAIGRMKGFGIVQGDQNGDLKLGDTITRAEIMKVLVTAAGKGDDAQLLRGAPAFSDTQAHWASGYVALAKAMGYTIGYPDGTFRPDNKITYGEIITLVVRAVGLDVSAQAYTWPNNYIHAAMDAGIIPPGIDATKVAGDFAIRSYVFLLADQAFLTVKLPSGKTTYQTHFVTIPPTLTVDQGASLSTSKDMVTISGSTNGISVTVGGAAAELTNGTFSTDVSVKLGSSTVAVVASDAVGNTTTANVAVTRSAAAAASISVDLPASVTAGSETAVTATVKDSYGNEIADAVVTGTCDAAVGTYDEATGKLTAAQAVGSGNCSFSSGAATTGDQAVSVVAGDLATLTINGAASMASSAKQAFTISSADQYGNTVTAPSAVTWSASAGVIDQSGNYAPGGASGAVTITATSGAISATKTVTVYGTAAAIQLSLSSNNIVANNKSTSTLTANVVDSNGNVAASYSGTVSLLSNNTAIASLGSTTSITITNGTGSATVTAGSTVGSAVISATGTGITGATVTATTVAQTLTGVTLSADPANLAADATSETSISVKLVDQTGNPMLATPSAGVKVTLASGTTAVGTVTGTNPVVSYTAGVGTSTVKAANNTGSTVISISGVTNGAGTALTGLNLGTVTVTTSLVGPAYQLTIDPISDALAYTAGTTGDTKHTIVIRVKDAFGNQVTGQGSGTISLASTFTGTGSVTTTNNAISGGKVTYTATNNKAETVTYTATTSLSGVTKATATGVFNPGPAAGVTLTPAPASVGVNGSTTLTVKVVDNPGNTVTAGSYSVKISRTTSNGDGTGTASANVMTWSGDQTVTTSNGTASITVPAGSTVGTDYFKATITLSSTSAPSSSVQLVTTAVIGPSAQLLFAGNASTAAGTAATVSVKLRDGSSANSGTGIDNTSDNSSMVTLTLTDANSAVTSYTATAVNGVATFSPAPTAKGSYTLKATAGTLKAADGSSTGNPSATLTVTAGAAAGLKVTPSLTTFSADNGASSITALVQWVDAYGNATDSPTTAPNTYFTGVALASNSSAVAVDTVSYCSDIAGTTCGEAVAGNAASAKWTLKSSGAPGSATLTASPNTNSTLTSGTVGVSTYFAGTGTQLAIAAITDTSTSNSITQTVKVSVLDAQGNLVTGYPTANVITLTASGTDAVYSTTKGVYDGVATFTVTNTKAETVTYTASRSGLTSATADGKFVPGAATQVVVGNASPQYITGNGSSIASVTSTVQDVYGNTVTSAAGTMKFEIVNSTSDWAFFQGAASDGSLTVSVSNGSATAVLQAKNVTAGKYVAVKGTFTKTGDTSALANHTNTSALGVAYASASAATYVYTVASSTSTTVTFSQPVKVAEATNIANYVITGGGTIGTLTYDPATNKVTIPTSASITALSLGANAIHDFNGNAVSTVTP